MEKAAVGLLRWGVILGLLVALPAFAMRGKWDEIAELLLDDDATVVATADGDLQFPDSSEPPSPSFEPPNSPYHSAPPKRSPDAPTSRSGSEGARQARDLRVSVYRPLGNADQTIRRIPTLEGQAADNATLADLEQQLRDQGAKNCRWSYDAASGEYHLMCEFADGTAGAPRRLEARSADAFTAMRQLLVSAQSRASLNRR